MSTLAYQESLPKKRMGAGCLFFDEAGRVLLVKPGYKLTWEIPGGVVEQNESPKTCCQREVLEELGLSKEIGRLLIVDYSGPTATRTEALMFIFDGGLLTDAEIQTIRLPAQELIGFKFFSAETLPEAMTETLRRRVLAAMQQVNEHGARYMEGQPI